MLPSKAAPIAKPNTTVGPKNKPEHGTFTTVHEEQVAERVRARSSARTGMNSA